MTSNVNFLQVGPTGPNGPIGNQGERGPLGKTGHTGNQGPIGGRGTKGLTGERSINSVTTQPYDPNNPNWIPSASVTNSGTPTDAKLDFVLPQGPPGTISSNYYLDPNDQVGTSIFNVSETTGDTKIAGTLDVGGDSDFSNNIIVHGQLTCGGLQVGGAGTVISITDPVVNLGDDTATDAVDRGIAFKYTLDGTTTKQGFFGYDKGENEFTFIPDATNTSNAFTGTKGTARFGKVYAELGLDGNVTGTVSSLSNHDTDGVSEGTTNKYYTDTRARAAISVTDSGGDGSLSYSSGVITYTGPSATETRTHFSGGDGISLSSGAISIDEKMNGGLVIESNKLAVDLGASSITGTLAVSDGGTGATTAPMIGVVTATDATAARSTLGLGNVDNTADTAKPVSTAQQTAFDLKATIASPTFTGTVAGIDKTMVGLGNVENTALSTGNAASATILETARTIGSASFDGSSAIEIQLTTQSSGNTPGSSPSAGTMIFDTNNNKIYIYNGGWRYIDTTSV